MEIRLTITALSYSPNYHNIRSMLHDDAPAFNLIILSLLPVSQNIALLHLLNNYSTENAEDDLPPYSTTYFIFVNDDIIM